MKDSSKTKKELIEELSALKKKIKKLEKSESEQKPMSIELNNSGTKYHQFAEDMPALICSFLPDSTLTYVNSAYCELFQKQPEDLVGQKFLDFLPDEATRENVRRQYMSLTPENPVKTYEHKVIVADGTNQYHWHRWTDHAFFNDNREIIHFQSIGEDITDYKRAEDALRESEEKHRIVLEESSDPVFSFTPEGQYKYVNKAFARGVGKLVEDIIGKKIWDVFTKEEADKRFSALSQVFRTGEQKIIEVRVPLADSAKYYITTITPVKDRTGNVISAICSSKDITDRKQAEDALRDSEERFRKIFDESPLGIVITLPSLSFEQANPSFCNMMGYSVDELHSMTFADITHPDYLKQDIKYIKKVGCGDIPFYQTEKVYITKNGKMLWGNLIVSGIHAEHGELRYYLSMVTDITERKQVEERYRSIVENAQEGIFQVTAEGSYLTANRALAKMLAYDSPEDLMTTVADIQKQLYLNPEDRKVLIQMIEEQGPVRGFEVQFYKKNGDIIWVSVNQHAIRDAAGRVLYYEGFNEDITERKRAEEELRESRQIIEEIINAIPVRVFWKDKNLVFLGCNAAFARDAGFVDPKDIIGKDDYQMVWRDQAELYRSDDRQVLESGHSKFFIEEPQKTPEGNIITLLTSKVPLRNSKGEISGVLGTYMDITDRKRAEEEKQSLEERLQRAEKMEALGLLAGGVAHDLNNVIGVIVGYAELIADDMDESSPMRKGLINIMEGGQRAAAIVQDLLTLARRGVAGRNVLNVNRLILDFDRSPEWEKLNTYHPSVHLQTDLEPDLLNISASPVHLQKTLFNLVSNAAEAMPTGGNITIKTTNQYLDKPVHGYDNIHEGDYVVLSVSDTGEGMPEQDLKRIFEPFYTKKIMGRSGTGLGLAVVWGTLKDHQGYIDVRSEEGKGTTFTLYFPVTRDDITAEASSISLTEYMGNGESILVVDDVQGQRDLASAMLQKLNYKVASVASGEEALEYLKKNKVDLLILDMIMEPGMDGLDTYKSILKTNPQQKAIIVSGFSESDRVHNAQALGAGEYVKKPYVIEKLGMAVKKELTRSA